MADGRDQAPAFSFRRAFPWTEIFRCFQVALDPRKLAVAALGILAMSLGWWVLARAFYYDEPRRENPTYLAATVAKDYQNKPVPGDPEAFFTQVGAERFEDDRRRWVAMDELAGPFGRFRLLPWDEYRGPNPYLLVTKVIGGSSVERDAAFRDFRLGSLPVLVEPLTKFLVPVSKLFAPESGTATRLLALLAILWFLAVWGFCGGVITRLAVVSLTNKGPTTLRQAVRFVAARYLNYLLSPMVPLFIIAAVVVGLMVYGLLSLIPVLGDIVLLGFGFPLVVAAGAVMAVFLVGLVGYPLMYTTLSTEGDSSDTFDALSRSINYVYQAPWHYAWYSLVAVVYGAVVTFFVLFFGCLSVYLGKWAVSQTPLTETFNRHPDYLFLYAPQSFGWQELLLQGSPAAVKAVAKPSPSDRQVFQNETIDPARREKYRAEYYWYNYAGAGIVAFWLTLMFLMLLGFTYSFYWSAASMIYLLMRKKVDEADLDEVYLEEDEPEAPVAPPKPDPTTPPGGTSLNVLPAPAAPAPPPAAAAPTLPFTPPSPPLSPPPSSVVIKEMPPITPDELKGGSNGSTEGPPLNGPKGDGLTPPSPS